MLKQWRRGAEIELNNRLDVRHVESNQWLEARVIDIDAHQPDLVFIHYRGYHQKYEEWVSLLDSERVAEVGFYSKAYGHVSIADASPAFISSESKAFSRGALGFLHARKRVEQSFAPYCRSRSGGPIRALLLSLDCPARRSRRSITPLYQSITATIAR